jgi:hypothetical protein
MTQAANNSSSSSSSRRLTGKDAEIVINTAGLSPEEAAQAIILYMEREGFIGVNDSL